MHVGQEGSSTRGVRGAEDAAAELVHLADHENRVVIKVLGRRDVQASGTAMAVPVHLPDGWVEEQRGPLERVRHLLSR
ncbi:DUF5959 family protein [Streptomyces sp. NPDC056390]|uniref:DUF5959 family protein n=1 Tax=Streptomyces sp. NPDC056390 TaxID=3345806 RepID=UPI0035DFABCB